VTRKRTWFESYEPEALLLQAHNICPDCESDAAEMCVTEAGTEYACVKGHGYTVFEDGKGERDWLFDTRYPQGVS
jgi:hypothetical protein